MPGAVRPRIFAHLPKHRDAFPTHDPPSYSLASAAPVDPLARNTPFRPVTRLPARPRCAPPNFARVDLDISSGKLTITAAWREYAAHAPRRYARGVFSRLYRQWQAASPVDEVEEFAASERYWHGRAAPSPGVLVLDDGASIRMKGGLLEVFNRGETRRFDPSLTIASARRSSLQTGAA